MKKVKNPFGETLFFYDKAGNRISHSVNTAQEALVEKYLYDAGNRLMSVEKLRDELEVEQYRYDKQGNMLSDGRLAYCYDAFNRCAMAEAEGLRQVNHYDAEGLRHEMEENGQLVKFIFSGNEVVVEEESDGNIIRYIRGLSLISSDSEKARCYYHYASDEMGSITHIAAGTEILNHYEYDIFGNTTVCEEQIPNRFRYTGQQYDAVTSQYYLRARFYNPVIGRFLQEDTYLGDGLNLFAYCQNNPLMYYDPSGYAGMVCADKYAQWKKLREKGYSPQDALEKTNDYRLFKKIRATDPGMTSAQAYSYLKTFKKMDSSNFDASGSYNATVDADFIKLKNKTVIDLIPMDKIKDYDGKTPPKDTYTPDEIAKLRSERDSVPDVTSSTIMQKVIPEESLHYLFENKAQLGGFVAKAQYAAPYTKTMTDTYESMRLDYHTSTYDSPDKDLYVVRFRVAESDIAKGLVQTPYSSDFKDGGFDISKYSQPCTGNGYTGSANAAVPEYDIQGRVSPAEAVLYKNNQPYAFYNTKTKIFTLLGEN